MLYFDLYRLWICLWIGNICFEYTCRNKLYTVRMRVSSSDLPGRKPKLPILQVSQHTVANRNQHGQIHGRFEWWQHLSRQTFAKNSWYFFCSPVPDRMYFQQNPPTQETWPLKIFWGPGPLVYRFKPLHWRFQWCLGVRKFGSCEINQFLCKISSRKPNARKPPFLIPDVFRIKFRVLPRKMNQLFNWVGLMIGISTVAKEMFQIQMVVTNVTQWTLWILEVDRLNVQVKSFFWTT